MSLVVCETPWKPATIGIAPSSIALEIRPGVTSMIRANPCTSSVITPACDPVKERASMPRVAIAIASSAIEIRSPEVSSMSSSRPGGAGVTWLARSFSSSVVSPIADTTTTTWLPACRVATMRLATRLMPSASATEEPPYFCTTRAIWTRRSSQVSVGGPPPSLSARRHHAQSLNRPGGEAHTSRTSHVEQAPALERTAQGDLVRVLQVAADRQPAGRPRHPDAHRLDEPGDKGRGRLALQVRVGRQDQLGDPAVRQPGHQLLDPQVVRADPVDRADRPAEHVVATAELADLLHRGDVLGLLDDADNGLIAPGVQADPALLRLGHVPAGLAESHALGHLEQRVRQPADVLGVAGQQRERDPLGALRPDARQPAELVDQVLDDAFIHARPSVLFVLGAGFVGVVEVVVLFVVVLIVIFVVVLVVIEGDRAAEPGQTKAGQVEAATAAERVAESGREPPAETSAERA